MSPETEAIFHPGQIVDRYEILRPIGRGGMGEVYLALDTTLGRKVALKVVLSSRLGSDKMRRRFIQEARNTARFNHPHIITVYGVGQYQEHPYVALEYIEGDTLRQRMQQERLTPQEALRIAWDILKALKEAHAHKLLHRDLKPENIILPRDGRLRVLDFGLAKRLSAAPTNNASTTRTTPQPNAMGLPPEEHQTTETFDPPSLNESLVGDVPGPNPSERDTTASRPAELDPLFPVPRPTPNPQPPPIETPHKLPAITSAGISIMGMHAPKETATTAYFPEPSPEPPLPQTPLTTHPTDETPASIDARIQAMHKHLSTQGKALRGTPAYMAPEQWACEPCTEATDIWAWAILTFELLTGRRPFGGRHLIELSSAIRNAPAPPANALNTISEALATAIVGCFHKDPDKRTPLAILFDQLANHFFRLHSRTSNAPSNPFRGLFAFTERHAAQFFGREAESAAFVEQLRDVPTLPVVGISGAGKSSFIQAGVLPRLREGGRWKVLMMRPGSQPFYTLASRLLADSQTLDSHTTSHGSEAPRDKTQPEITTAQLANQLEATPSRLALWLRQLALRSESKLLLFVDQLEELYTLAPGSSTRRAFMEALCTAATVPDDPFRVVFTLRDDFLGRLASVPAARAVLGRVVILTAPDENALLNILQNPLEPLEYTYTPKELPQQIVDEVKDEPACLPLLQFAAHQLWERRDTTKRQLVGKAYKAMGGVAGALASHADGLLDGLSHEQIEISRTLLLRLVTSNNTRKVVAQSELLEGQGTDGTHVLEQLVQARLINVRKSRAGVAREPLFELVHESLLQRWHRLARWLEESREERIFQAEIAQAAKLWHKRGRRPEEAWSGEALEDAQRNVKRLHTKLPALSRAFIEAGENKALLAWRRKRNRQHGAIALAIALLLAALWSIWRIDQARQQAQRHSQEANQQRNHANQRLADAIAESARVSILQENFIQAKAKLRSSLELRDSPTMRYFWQRLQQHPVLWRKPLSGAIYDIKWTPDGTRLLVGNQDNTINRLDPKTHTIKRMRGHSSQVLVVATHPHKPIAASGDRGGMLILWDLATETVRFRNKHTRIGLQSLAFHSKQPWLATAGMARNVRLWNWQTKRDMGDVTQLPKTIKIVAFHPSQPLLACASARSTVFLVDPLTKRIRQRLQGHQGAIIALHFGPKALYVVTEHGVVHQWQPTNDRHSYALASKVHLPHKTHLRRVSFSPRMKYLATATTKRIAVWHWKQRRVLAPLPGRFVNITSIAFSPDGNVVIAGGWGSFLKAYAWRRYKPKSPSDGHQAPINDIAFLPDSQRLLTVAWDQRAFVWHAQRVFFKRLFQYNGASLQSIAVNRQGTHIAIVGWDGTLHIQHQRKWRTIKAHNTSAMRVRFHPKGHILATTSKRGEVVVWTRDGNQQHRFNAHRGAVNGIAFHPTKPWLASCGSDRKIQLWNTHNGQRIKTLLMSPYRVYDVAFTPDGRALLYCTAHGGVWYVDLATSKKVLIGQHDSRTYHLDIHPKGQMVASASADRSIGIWRIPQRVRSSSRPSSRPSSHPSTTRPQRRTIPTPIARLLAHAKEANTVRFSPDGRFVASGSDDRTVRLWRVGDWQPVWRAPLFDPKRELLATHRGFVDISHNDKHARIHPPKTQWQKAVVQRATDAQLGPNRRWLCLYQYNHHFALWDTKRDIIRTKLTLTHPPKRQRIKRIKRIFALPNGCGIWDGQQIVLLKPNGQQSILYPNVDLITTDGDGWFVVQGRKVTYLTHRGHTVFAYTLPTSEKLYAMVADLKTKQLIVAFVGGQIRAFSLAHSGQRSTLFFEQLNASPISHMHKGPRRTLIVGFRSGLVMMWSLRNGALLQKGWLYGPLQHSALRNSKLFAISDLGSRMQWKLDVFTRSYCSIMREVWTQVPLVWENRQAILKAPPLSHPCLKTNFQKNIKTQKQP